MNYNIVFFDLKIFVLYPNINSLSENSYEEKIRRLKGV